MLQYVCVKKLEDPTGVTVDVDERVRVWDRPERLDHVIVAQRCVLRCARWFQSSPWKTVNLDWGVLEVFKVGTTTVQHYVLACVTEIEREFGRDVALTHVHLVIGGEGTFSMVVEGG